MLSLHLFIVAIVASAVPFATAFQIPHACHHHPLYICYRQDQFDQHGHDDGLHSQVPSPSDLMKAQGVAVATCEENYYTSRPSLSSSSTLQPTALIPLEDYAPDVSISTHVSYDEETGMVQTAVRAIVQHPISTVVDNHIVGLSSTLVITTGALHEIAHCLELEWTHHATSSTEGLAILSLGHFLHYVREAIRQLVELHDTTSNRSEDEESSSEEQ